VHLSDASSLLFGSYAPPPEISQLSPSTILRHDTYQSVLGSAFNPVAPTGLALQAPTSLPTLNFPCLAPPPSLPAQTDLLVPASHSAPPDLLQSTSPPGAPLAQNVSLSERESVACPKKKTRIRTSHLSSKQRIKAFTLLPPPPPQSPLVCRGKCVVCWVEAVARVALLRPPSRRLSPAISKGRPRPLRAFTSSTSSTSSNLNQGILLSL